MTNSLSRVFGLFLAVAAMTSTFAQDNGAEALSNPDVAGARAMIEDGREMIIREELQLTAAEEAAFWPLYQKYRSDLAPVQNRYVALIADYMKHYDSGVLTDAYANEVLEGYFDVKGDLLRTRKKYVRRFGKILPMLKVARFYHLENKINAELDAELAYAVPLIESN